MAKFESNDFWNWLCQELAGAFGVARPQSVGGDKDRPVADSTARDDLVDWISKTPLQLMQTAARKPALTPEMLDAVDRILFCPDVPLEDSRKVFAVPDYEPKVLYVHCSLPTVKPTVDNWDDAIWTFAVEQGQISSRVIIRPHSEPFREEKFAEAGLQIRTIAASLLRAHKRLEWTRSLLRRHGTMPNDSVAVRSHQEVADAIRDLTTAEWGRLRKVAARLEVAPQFRSVR
jgi:hypothetical protein